MSDRKSKFTSEDFGNLISAIIEFILEGAKDMVIWLCLISVVSAILYVIVNIFK